MILVLDNYDSFTYNLVHLSPARRRRSGGAQRRAQPARRGRPGPRRHPDLAGAGASGGRGAVGGRPAHLWRDVPILGVCLGHQAIGQVFGASVTYAPTLMHGKTSEVFHHGTPLYDGVSNPFTATRYHSLVVARATLPDELEVTCETADGVVMGLRHRTHPIEGVQFHPESVLTTEGPTLVANWLRFACAPSPRARRRPADDRRCARFSRASSGGGDAHPREAAEATFACSARRGPPGGDRGPARRPGRAGRDGGRTHRLCRGDARLRRARRRATTPTPSTSAARAATSPAPSTSPPPRPSSWRARA